MNTFSKFLRSIFPNPFLKYRNIFEISKLTTIKPTVLHKYIVCRYNILRQFEFYHHNDGNYSHNFHKVFPYHDMIQQISAYWWEQLDHFLLSKTSTTFDLPQVKIEKYTYLINNKTNISSKWRWKSCGKNPNR